MAVSRFMQRLTATRAASTEAMPKRCAISESRRSVSGLDHI
jgi:hypothetical protein